MASLTPLLLPDNAQVGDASLRQASLADLSYILDRAKVWSNQIGFIRQSNIEGLLQRGRGWIVDVNGEPAGHLLVSGGDRRAATLRHVTVEPALWAQGIGEAACREVLRWVSEQTRFDYLMVRTRRDLIRQTRINLALGGQVVGTSVHVGQRGEPVRIWRLPVSPSGHRRADERAAPERIVDRL